MHELSICRAIADTALDHANGRPLRRIRLRIGHFRQVVPETLEWCWQFHTDGTTLDGCSLDVEYLPAMVTCSTCGAATELTLPALRCAACGGVDVQLTSGDEFLIESIDVAEEVP